MWNARWLWTQWRGMVLHLVLIWGTPIYFAFLKWQQCSSLVVTVFLGILFSSIREIEVPYVFEWEHGTPQHEMRWNRASSCGEGEVSLVFSSCGRHLVYILELRRGWPFDIRVCSAKSGLLSSYDGHFGKLNYAWRKIQTLLEVGCEAKHPLLVWTVILVFLSIFMKCQASSPFEALNSAHISKYQMDVRPSVQKSLKTMAFSRVSSGDSDIPSSCEIKDEAAFKPLQGKPAFFWVRESRGPLYLRQKT